MLVCSRVNRNLEWFRMNRKPNAGRISAAAAAAAIRKHREEEKSAATAHPRTVWQISYMFAVIIVWDVANWRGGIVTREPGKFPRDDKVGYAYDGWSILRIRCL